jgi:hypothetical protein
MSNNSKIFNIGTTVYFEGDDANRGGYGTITDYLGEEEFTVTLEDGRVINNVTPGDFETPVVLGNKGMPEFQVVDTVDDVEWTEEELDLSEGWQGLIGEKMSYREGVVPEIRYLY